MKLEIFLKCKGSKKTIERGEEKRNHTVRSHEAQDGQVTLKFKQLTKHSRPFRFVAAGPFGIVTGSVAREAADRGY